jgi:hypothetical protein
MALESRNIRTIATQERFAGSFTKLFGSIIIDDYLCDSQFVADIMEKSPIVSVKHFIPVGQYRSDKLLEMKNTTPPKILETPIKNGAFIITALGYDTWLYWHPQPVQPLINWKAHKKFLDDMIQLAKDLPDIFIVLRHKEIKWMDLPVFSESVQIIRNSKNIVFSEDYDMDYASYNLCTHSHLVIARYTSLADECLSVGIPVLFYEYTHNTERILADAFDYHPARIMCYNYNQLFERTKEHLDGIPADVKEKYQYLEKEIFGGLGDGMVKRRIHNYIDSLLTT